MDWLKFEREIWQSGKALVAGVDEAGRGPLAGPVVAAAVILPQGCDLEVAVDSKLLSADERIDAFEIIHKVALCISFSASSASHIDRFGILPSTLRAMTDATTRLHIRPDYVLVDGRQFPPDLQIAGRAIVDGDAQSRSIAAASIVAKVVRDRLMTKLHLLHPGYGFDEHKGYATPRHLDALSRLGPCPHHRFSFSPIRQNALSLKS